jgi:hypothetical protein
MASYMLAIQATDLSDFDNQVKSEEAGGSAMQSSVVGFDEGALVNIVKFDELAAGTRPKAFVSVLQGKPAPADTKLVWAGVVLLGDDLESVQSFRKTK